ncbi:DUF551 domain-containing protein [Klebsiella pneumoniae]|uniref:DUF551 domain-containing protein n=1 Tax=Klebsiella pneumoniae TaxID=573 RepID=UPI0020A744CE|nr:DUF551 domain-containing protein [Klebsiella pneumoniae]MCP3214373.1 DUF551 domain-containing protein [Klebsiella pneumoniae]HCO1391763.1 DUF551 domain-containing protein [Escherichia coli]
MTKSTITRERAQQIFLGNGPEPSASEERELARMTLVAMDSEPVAIIDQANLDYLRSGADADVWPPEREEMGDVLLYRHAQPAPVAQKEPISFDEWSRKCALQITLCYPDFREKAQYIWDSARETQQPAPVVPEDVLDALQKVARIRLDLNGFDGDRRGIADCLCDAEEALIEVVNRRAAMLQGAENAESRCGIQTAPALDSFKKNSESRCGNSPVIPDGYRLQPISEYEAMCATVNSDEWPQRWIPVSERMPEDRTQVILWDAEIGEVTSGHYSHKTHTFYHCGDAIQNEITHWMPLPAAPQEVK